MTDEKIKRAESPNQFSPMATPWVRMNNEEPAG